MPYKEITNFKKYWTIGEVAIKLGVKYSKIVFYIDQFNIKINKKEKHPLGYKKYLQKNDIEKLKFILYLLNNEEFKISGAIKKFNQYKTLNNYLNKNVYINSQ